MHLYCLLSHIFLSKLYKKQQVCETYHYLWLSVVVWVHTDILLTPKTIKLVMHALGSGVGSFQSLGWAIICCLIKYYAAGVADHHLNLYSYLTDYLIHILVKWISLFTFFFFSPISKVIRSKLYFLEFFYHSVNRSERHSLFLW